ncbi:acyl-CoA desaturase [Cytophagaceae bacterium ABcell3]|nr:acyl-CoA desaturase [Cytophagaceae bacterium ABcell3]
MTILLFFVLHWYLSLFTQTFFHHRYGAHKMFSMNKFWERTFYILSYLFQGSSYLTPRAYGILHRMHHAYSDTEKDPHSPHYHNNIFTMMWHTRKIYNDLVYSRKEIGTRFANNLPEWKFIDNLGESGYSRIAWGLLYIGFYVAFATQWWMFLLLPIHFLMGAVHGAIVNWFGHKMGYANFDNNDKSKNTLVFDFFMLGELFQNNHHKHADKPNFGAKWYEFDPVYPIIKLLSMLRIIKLPKTPEMAKVNQ